MTDIKASLKEVMDRKRAELKDFTASILDIKNNIEVFPTHVDEDRGDRIPDDVIESLNEQKTLFQFYQIELIPMS